MTYRLGRLPHDPARVAAVQPHRMGASGPLPATYPGAARTWTPTTSLRGTLPTCVVDGLANSARLWAMRNGFDLVVDDGKLLGLYAMLAGCAPTPEAIGLTDGLVMLAALEHVAAHGFDIGLQTPLAMEFRAIDPQDNAAIRDAIYTKASALMGFTLYQNDMQEPLSWQGAPAGAVVGGHCIVPWRWGVGGFEDATWGETIDCDDAWLAARIEEGYALAWGL